jgi:HEAT repeat protein
MPVSEDVKKVKDIIQSFLKAKKILRMYPENNPIYINTLEDSFGKFKDYFYDKEELCLKIKQNEIFYDSEQIYFNPEKEDNLALFFFKDGIREITFKQGLTHEEMEEFLKIASLDFSREALDDDIVTLFWEKDFQYIQYVVDDIVLADAEDYEAKAVMEMHEKASDEDNLLMAYEDAFNKDDTVKDVFIIPLTDKDLSLLVKELEKDSQDKIEKLIDILFELFYSSGGRTDSEDNAGFLINALEYSMGHADIHTVTSVMSRLKQITQDRSLGEEIKKQAYKILLFAGSEPMITLMGEVLDSGLEIEEKLFDDFVKFLDRNAIVSFMKILGDLQSIHARKIVIDALIFLGTKDIVTLAKGLSDSRWYVVRNIIYVLRKIGDKRAVDYLLKTVRHGDIRVKKEVIRTLGELGGGGVLQALRDCLDDPDIQVRAASLKALSNIGSEAAKRIILNKISDKIFKDRDFGEKKEYFEALSKWKDNEIYDFLVRTIKKKTFLRRAKNYENRACAAYSLGLIGNKNALPILNKCKNDSNKLLKEFSHSAIKRLEYGQ